MKSTCIPFILTGVLLFFGCQKAVKTAETSDPQQVVNPILPGFYSDPSVCKGPDGYYMVQSTFAYFPGIPVFYSPDLLHWEQIGSVLTRRDQLLIDGQDISTRGTYAATIEYHEGRFFVTCTEVGHRGNYITTAADPAGSWSDLNFIPEVNGIDPSLFFNDDGRTYIVYNSGAPENKPLYNGHRTIRMNEINIDQMKVIGESSILVNGGTDIAQEPVWVEGPHLYKVGAYYYLSAAEGGTGVNHSQVIFRSQEIDGSYKPWEENPILTQRYLDPNRNNPITSTGHADLIQDLDGDWWAVFLGCRPYEGDHYNLGRETFMSPVNWENGWPRINPDFESIQLSYPFPAAVARPKDYVPLNGNFTIQDDFKSPELDFAWMMIRTTEDEWYEVQPEGDGHLQMNVRPFSSIHEGQPAFIGRRQQHLRGNVSVALSFTPQRQADKAGLVVFQNIGHFYYVCKSLEEGKEVVELYKGEGDGYTLLERVSLVNDGALRLKIASDRDVYRCYYAEENQGWKQIGSDLDARYLSTQTAGGFTGCLYGMFAFSDDDVSDLTASYDWFNYEGND